MNMQQYLRMLSEYTNFTETHHDFFFIYFPSFSNFGFNNFSQRLQNMGQGQMQKTGPIQRQAPLTQF